GNSFEALQVGKQEVRALVGRNSSRKAQSKDVLAHLQPGLFADMSEQFRLCQHMRFENLAGGDALSVAKTEVVLPPVGDVMVVERLKGRRRPGSSVHPIGDRVNLVSSEHEARNFPMLLC